MAFTLTSPAFVDGNTIPIQFTCDGNDAPPPLLVSDPPEGTKSYAVIMDDPDAPNGLFTHWMAYDVPVERKHSDVVTMRPLPSTRPRRASLPHHCVCARRGVARIAW